MAASLRSEWPIPRRCSPKWQHLVPTSGAGGKKKTFLQNPDLIRGLGWRSAPSLETIAAAANQYAAAQFDVHAGYADACGLPGLQQAVQRLKGALDSAQAEPLSCLLCLGWGGGFASKTAFLDTNLDSYRKVLRAVPSLSKSIRDKVPFPKTRRVIFADGQPAYTAGLGQRSFGAERLVRILKKPTRAHFLIAWPLNCRCLSL